MNWIIILILLLPLSGVLINLIIGWIHQSGSETETGTENKTGRLAGIIASTAV